MWRALAIGLILDWKFKGNISTSKEVVVDIVEKNLKI